MFLTAMFAVLMFVMQNGQEFFQQAMVQENAAGNLEAAIQLYQDAARYSGGDRELAARALLGVARCYEKLGQARAKEIYEEVARTYADQKTQAATARDRANALRPRSEVTNRANLGVHETTGTPNPRLVPVGPGIYWDRPPVSVPQFDTSSSGRITFTGTITRIEWSNPNVTIVFDSKTRLLAGSPNSLLQNGWSRTSLRLGEVVTVEAFQGVAGQAGRDPRDTEALVVCCGTITLSDGRKLPMVDPTNPPASTPNSWPRPNQ